MSAARTLERYLDEHHVRYDMVTHPSTPTAMRAAVAAHINADCLAKAVMLADQQGYVMAVVPATHQVRLRRLREETGRNLHLASEMAFAPMFPDCVVGAVPPLGMAYGMDTIWDDSLMEREEIYFEAGDHECLMHVSGRDFIDMMSGCKHGRFSTHI